MATTERTYELKIERWSGTEKCFIEIATVVLSSAVEANLLTRQLVTSTSHYSVTTSTCDKITQ